MTPTTKPHAALVGTGFIGSVHLDALRRLGIPITGIVGSSQARAEQKAAEWGVDRAYANYEEMLADEAVDVVHITSPNDHHFEQARAALIGGKHVICEKPLAMDSTETRELAALAESTGLIAAVNFNVRFYPQVHEMRERIAAGVVGAPFLVTGSYQQDWLLHDTDWNWRVESARGGELRVVGDIGSHWFDLASFVTGQRIVEVMADLTTFVPVRRRPVGEVATFAAATGDTQEYRVTSEDAASILVRLSGGARGVVTVSQVSAGRKNAIAIEVNAAEASLSWKGERPEELWIGHRGKPNEVSLRDPSQLSPGAQAVTGLPGGHSEGFENAFKSLYASVYADVRAGRRSPDSRYATFDDGHHEAQVVEAVAESARTGAWVTVGQN